MFVGYIITMALVSSLAPPAAGEYKKNVLCICNIEIQQLGKLNVKFTVTMRIRTAHNGP